MSNRENARWRAVIWYRATCGLVDVEYWLAELTDLHDRIESGPHFDTVEKIDVVRVNHIDNPGLTIEQAEQL